MALDTVLCERAKLPMPTKAIKRRLTMPGPDGRACWPNSELRARLARNGRLAHAPCVQAAEEKVPGSGVRFPSRLSSLAPPATEGAFEDYGFRRGDLIFVVPRKKQIPQSASDSWLPSQSIRRTEG